MKPILFNGDMVRTILNGQKTVTRRVIKNAPKRDDLKPYKTLAGYGLIALNSRVFHLKPPYLPGDILYVRETFCPFDKDHVVDGVKYAYKADATPESEQVRRAYGYKWRPSIHMPKKATRIFLRVTDVHVERLQDITPEQAMKEGVISKENRPFIMYEQVGQLELYARNKIFPEIWNSTIKPATRTIYGWNANPWVFVIEFERIIKEEANEFDSNR